MKKNSSTQDAGNQTETCLPYHVDVGVGGSIRDGVHEISKIDVGMKSRNREEGDGYREVSSNDADHEYAVGENFAISDFPDFSGLQLLLNGIERVEHGRPDDAIYRPRDVNLSANNATAKTTETKNVHTTTAEECDSRADKHKLTPNSLEILCALADQRLLEENEGDGIVYYIRR